MVEPAERHLDRPALCTHRNSTRATVVSATLDVESGTVVFSSCGSCGTITFPPRRQSGYSVRMSRTAIARDELERDEGNGGRLDAGEVSVNARPIVTAGSRSSSMT